MFWTDRTSSAVCAPNVPGKAATSSRKARRSVQLFSFSHFELVLGKRVIGPSAEKFRSENQSIKLTETSGSLPSLSLTSPSITHKTGPLRQAVFKVITIDFLTADAFTVGTRAWAASSSGRSRVLAVAAGKSGSDGASPYQAHLSDSNASSDLDEVGHRLKMIQH
jgi:hypothetical protein